MESWLTNELRPYFGLQLLQPDWQLLKITSSYWIVVDGDIIRKRISCTDQAYHEDDVHIVTRDQQWILSQTAKGKEKKLNFSSVSAVKANGIVFSAGILDRQSARYPYVTVYNPSNGFYLPIRSPESCTMAAELISWLQAYPSRLPSDYTQKLDRFCNTKRKRYSAIPGDIFRIELDLYTDAYILVIGDLRRMQKDGLFSEHSIWNNVMTMPLFVRPYLYRTEQRQPELNKIISAPLSDTCWIVMDDHFLRGNYEKVGHKRLEEEDIVFPIGYGVNIATPRSVKAAGEDQEVLYRLSWGTGTAVKPKIKVHFTAARKYDNNAVYTGVSEKCFYSQTQYNDCKTLDNPAYASDRARAMAEYGFAADISYDEFNRRTGGLTRTQYLDYLNRTYPAYQQ